MIVVLSMVGWLVSVACGGSAEATINLSGSWTVLGAGSTLDVTLTQDGTALSWEPGGFVGTIDSTSGAFSLVGAPAPGGFIGGLPYGPSPAPTIDGAASADGNTLTGTYL